MLDQIWTFGARGGFKNDKKHESHNVCVNLKVVQKREKGPSQQKRLEVRAGTANDFNGVCWDFLYRKTTSETKSQKKIAPCGVRVEIAATCGFMW